MIDLIENVDRCPVCETDLDTGSLTTMVLRTPRGNFLVKLNVYQFRVRDVPINPNYGIGEESGIKTRRVVFSLSFLLLKLLFWRLKEKYIIRDFHPLVLFYTLGLSVAYAHRGDLGLDKETIREYMCSQEGVNKKLDQLKMFE